MEPGSVALRAAALGVLDGEEFRRNERGVTNGGALGSAGGVKAASKLSAAANHSSDASMAATQAHASYSMLKSR